MAGLSWRTSRMPAGPPRPGKSIARRRTAGLRFTMASTRPLICDTSSTLKCNGASRDQFCARWRAMRILALCIDSHDQRFSRVTGRGKQRTTGGFAAGPYASAGVSSKIGRAELSQRTPVPPRPVTQPEPGKLFCISCAPKSAPLSPLCRGECAETCLARASPLARADDPAMERAGWFPSPRMRVFPVDHAEMS